LVDHRSHPDDYELSNVKVYWNSFCLVYTISFLHLMPCNIVKMYFKPDPCFKSQGQAGSKVLNFIILFHKLLVLGDLFLLVISGFRLVDEHK
jgi:hypothetical protein